MEKLQELSNKPSNLSDIQNTDQLRAELCELRKACKNIFAISKNWQPITTNMQKHVLQFDGGSRGNPGLCGAGAVLFDKDDNQIFTISEKVSERNTNNYAEYMALFLGLQSALKSNILDLEVQGDSKLVVMQVTKQWSIKSENLIPIYNKIQDLIPQFNDISFNHILRNKNKVADKLANLAMDNS